MNANMLYKTTEQPPVQPTDYRTTTEKAADVDGLRREVRSFFASSGITDTTDANDVAQKLPPEGLVFVIRYKDLIQSDIKGRGLPADVVYQFVERLYSKVKQTSGVEFGLQQATGENILLSVQQMSQNMATPDQVRELISVVRQIPRGRDSGDIEIALRDLQETVNQLPSRQDFETMQQMPEGARADIQRIVSEAVQDIPTNTQTQALILGLENALKDGDRERSAQMVARIQDIFHLGTEARDQLREIQQLLRAAPSPAAATMPSPGLSPVSMNDSSGFVSAPGSQAEMTPIQRPSKRSRPANSQPTSGKPEQAKFKPSSAAAPPAARNLDSEMSAAASSSNAPATTNESSSSSVATKTDWRQLSMPQRREFLNRYLDAGNTLSIRSSGDTYSAQRKVGADARSTKLDGLFNDYLRKSQGQGHGIRGRGLTRRIEHRVEGSYVKPKPYKQFGRFLINRDKLVDDVLMIKRPGGTSAIATEKISHELASVFRALLRDEQPNMDHLNDDDLLKLDSVLRHCRCVSLAVPTPKLKSNDQQQMDRFNILRGEILAGNDSKELVREFKLMLVRFMNAGRIPRRQAQEILTDIASMGL
jgi:hypothetical protein